MRNWKVMAQIKTCHCQKIEHFSVIWHTLVNATNRSLSLQCADVIEKHGCATQYFQIETLSIKF